MNYKQFSMYTALITLCLTSLSLNAQVKKDASYYLNDAGISSSKNSVSINLAAIVNGDVPFIYERKLGKRVRLSGGVGILLPYYTYDLVTEREEDFSGYDPYKVEDRGFGKSYLLQFKYFGGSSNYERFYLGYYYRYRNFEVKNKGSITYSDNMIAQGYLHNFSNKFQLDVGTAIGLRSISKDFDTEIPIEYNINFAFSINIAIGYIF